MSGPDALTRTCSPTDRMARSLIPLLAPLSTGLDSTMYSCCRTRPTSGTTHKIAGCCSDFTTIPLFAASLPQESSHSLCNEQPVDLLHAWVLIIVLKEREVEVNLWQLPFATQACWCGISALPASEHNANTNAKVERFLLKKKSSDHFTLTAKGIRSFLGLFRHISIILNASSWSSRLLLIMLCSDTAKVLLRAFDTRTTSEVRPSKAERELTQNTAAVTMSALPLA